MKVLKGGFVMKANVSFYKNNWWMFLIEGIVTLLFGLVTVINPAQTFLTLSFFFGLFILVHGVVDIVIGLSGGRQRRSWIFSLVFGALQAVFGIYLLQRPGLSLATFVVFVALALLVRALAHAVEVFDSSYDAMVRTWQAIAAVVSGVASVMIWRYPVRGTLAFVWVLGVFAIINGPLMIAFSLEARNGFEAKK